MHGRDADAYGPWVRPTVTTSHAPRTEFSLVQTVLASLLVNPNILCRSTRETYDVMLYPTKL